MDLKGDMQSDLQLQFTQIDIDPLLRAELKGTITRPLRPGRARQPHWPVAHSRARSRARCVVDAFSVEVEKIPIHSDGPIELALADDVVSVQRLTMAARGLQPQPRR